jgi:hypothetical protein
MEEDWSNHHIRYGREASTEYEPRWAGKGKDKTAHFLFIQLYSVEAISQRQALNCTQVETGIRISVVNPKYRTLY